jgi:hypothetical protein
MVESQGKGASKSLEADHNPLYQRGILEQVLAWVGPGEHAFIAAVSKSFRAFYLTVAAVQREYKDEEGNAVDFMLVHDMTALSAIICSPSRMRLALELGFVPDFNKGWSQYLAGTFADIETLAELHKQYNMAYTEIVCKGAGISGSISKLQWLLDEQQCPQPDNFVCYAVYAATLDMLKYLKQRGHVFTADTCCAAASSRQAASALQYLHAEGAPLDARTMTEAIAYQEVPLLQWLYEHGCSLCEEAMHAALRLKELRVLSWLYSKNCPGDYEQVCLTAASAGDIELLQWVKDNGAASWSPKDLSKYLNVAGAHGHLDTAEVREHFTYCLQLYSLSQSMHATVFQISINPIQ